MVLSEATVFVATEIEDLTRRLRSPMRARRLSLLGVEPGAVLGAVDEEVIGCLLTDAQTALGDRGGGLLESLEQLGIDLPIVLLAGTGGVRQAVESMHRGAFDYLECPVTDGVLVAAIVRAVAEGRRRAERSRELRELAARAERLTKREREVLDLVASGSTNKAVATELGISCKTIEAHRASMMRKMRARNVVDLVRMHLRMPPVMAPTGTGLVDPLAEQASEVQAAHKNGFGNGLASQFSVRA